MSDMLRFWAFLIAVSVVRAQDPAPVRMEITLEKNSGGKITAMEPGHVFEPGDLVRFRFTPDFDGSLYVMERGTSGAVALMFPKDETGLDNKVQKGKTYVIPATEDGWFRVTGPPGHDIVYWFVTPVTTAAHAPALPAPPAAITPRCNDALFRARGDCIDSSAGPKASGSLFSILKNKVTVIGSTAPLDAPAAYEFHVAHK